MAEQGGQRTDDDQPKQAFVIGRLRPGREVASTVHEVERLLIQEGLSVEAEVVKKKREVRESVGRALKAGCDVVVVVGGDGTVLQVATALAGGDVPLAIVPTGTGNLLAGNLGIPKPPREAVHGRGRSPTAHRRRPREGQWETACLHGRLWDRLRRRRHGPDRQQAEGTLGQGRLPCQCDAEIPNIRNVRHEITIDGVRRTTKASQIPIANSDDCHPGSRPPVSALTTASSTSSSSGRPARCPSCWRGGRRSARGSSAGAGETACSTPRRERYAS